MARRAGAGDWGLEIGDWGTAERIHRRGVAERTEESEGWRGTKEEGLKARGKSPCQPVRARGPAVEREQKSRPLQHRRTWRTITHGRDVAAHAGNSPSVRRSLCVSQAPGFDRRLRGLPQEE